MMLPTIRVVLFLTCTTIFNVFPTKANDDEFKTYIVHLTSPQDQVLLQPHELEAWYNLLLSKVALGSNQKPKMVHAYHHVITGFAATMSPNQAKVLDNLNGVVSVRQENVYELHTTRSAHFLGLRQNSGFWKHSNFGKGVIIGLLDTGITPGHPSFDDKGMPAPPAKWKGKCEVAGCNNKLIGLRSFIDKNSPVDRVGHGTHTSSTAAGNFVEGANVFGMANGTASGIAPLAHVAMYKVCDFFCVGSAILAGMDAAIEDGVDVLSMSLGGPTLPFYEDSISIAAFAVMQKGIFMSCSAGNFGPDNSSLANVAPWVLTVGASTIDRRIRTTVKLGNNKRLNGESLYQPKEFNTHKLRPLVYPGKNNPTAAYCIDGSLDPADVKGKVVLCDVGGIGNVQKGQVVKDAEGVAIIIANDITNGDSIAAEAHVLPASFIGYNGSVEVKKYLNSTPSPVATILFYGPVTNLKSDPEVAAFSSRGPCRQSPGILKPDIIGPGVDTLAAWHESVDNNTRTKATFSVERGTSMSSPHLAGTAALLKRAHPEWSPAAIKSAMLTTASQVSRKGPIADQRGLPADIFAIGSGHVAPTKASDPGLVFDIQPDDYIPYLCGLGYTAKQVGMIVKKTVSCSETIPEAQLNYPSLSVSLKRGDSKAYTRTVTNVGPPHSVYSVNDSSIPKGVGVDMFIENGDGSQELSFNAVHQKQTFKIIFTRDIRDEKKGPYGQGHITFVYDKYSVRIPLSFKFE